jgi:hypothetical protein
VIPLEDSVYRVAGGIRDTERCTTCGGSCCQLYSRRWHEGSFLHKVRRWYRKLDEYIEEFGFYTPFNDMIYIENLPEPRFDAIRAWGADDEEYRRELIAAGINPRFCEYNDGNGCMLEWFDRPRVCRDYRCLRWRADELAARATAE